eukprot:11402450-Alexandrium_andersonii.AAC.1
MGCPWRNATLAAPRGWARLRRNVGIARGLGLPPAQRWGSPLGTGLPLAKRQTCPWARSPRLPAALLLWHGCAPVQLG